jgi:Kef-type K+ transport system membrane component KefB
MEMSPIQPVMRRPSTLLLGYLVLAALGIVSFFAIRSIGESSFAASPSTPAATAKPAFHPLPHLLGGLVAVIVLARMLGIVLSRLGQPRVIGEVIAGIMLGPSLLGKISPDAMEFLFPSQVLPILGMLAQLGIILYMFLVGLHLDSSLLRSRAHSTVVISHVSIIVPFLLGAGLALWLYEEFAPSGVSFTSFSLFLGLAMAITAFPVLARILTDRKIEKTEIGVIALSCAAADDVTAWCLLGIVVGVAQANLVGAIATIVFAIAYIALMLGVARPLVKRQFEKAPLQPTFNAVTWVIVVLLLSALLTEVIGIHAVFGAFLFGAVIPHDSELARSFRAKLEDAVTILLMPMFFAYTGMRTQIGLLSEGSDWLICVLIVVIATIGKFGGTLLAARFTGLNWRNSAVLGALMNTRGLMELVVLNIGLDLGVISPALFAMMVIMALVTTVVAAPLLKLFGPPEGQPAEKQLQRG